MLGGALHNRFPISNAILQTGNKQISLSTLRALGEKGDNHLLARCCLHNSQIYTSNNVFKSQLATLQQLSSFEKEGHHERAIGLLGDTIPQLYLGTDSSYTTHCRMATCIRATHRSPDCSNTQTGFGWPLKSSHALKRHRAAVFSALVLSSAVTRNMPSVSVLLSLCTSTCPKTPWPCHPIAPVLIWSGCQAENPGALPQDGCATVQQYINLSIRSLHLSMW